MHDFFVSTCILATIQASQSDPGRLQRLIDQDGLELLPLEEKPSQRGLPGQPRRIGTSPHRDRAGEA